MSDESQVLLTVRAYRLTPDGGRQELKAAEVRQGEPELMDRNAIPARFSPCRCPRCRAPR